MTAKGKYFLILLLSATRILLAQNPDYQRKVDSVKAIVAGARQDTQMVDALNTLSSLAWRKGNYAEADEYAARALVSAEKLNYLRGSAICYNNLGTVAWYKGDYQKALEQYIRSLKTMEKIGNKKGLSDAFNNIGMVHYYLGNYEKTIEYYRRSLAIDESLGLKAGVALSHNNIGGVYDEMGNENVRAGKLAEAGSNFDKALGEYLESQKISEELNDKSNLALCYSNMGNVLSEKALLEQEAGKQAAAKSLFEQSLAFHKRSLDLKEKADDKFGVAGSDIFLGETSLHMKRYDEAGAYFMEGLNIARQIGAKERQKAAYGGLANVYEQKKDLATAFKYRLLFTAIKDSIYNDELSEQIAGMQTKYETEKKVQQIALLNKEQDIQSSQLGRQQVIIWSASLILLIVVVSGSYTFNRFKVAKKQKRIIEGQKLQVERAFNQLHEKNQEVIDSIHYAHRIQKALITPERYIERALNKLMQKNS